MKLSIGSVTLPSDEKLGAATTLLWPATGAASWRANTASVAATWRQTSGYILLVVDARWVADNNSSYRAMSIHIGDSLRKYIKASYNDAQ